MNHCQLWKATADADLHNRGTFFLPTPSLTAFAQISRGPLFVQISGKYLEGFCLWFPLHRLLHLMKFDPRTMLSNCQLCCNPEGQLGLQLYPEKKTTFLCSCAEHFFLIFLNTELGSKNHMCASMY